MTDDLPATLQAAVLYFADLDRCRQLLKAVYWRPAKTEKKRQGALFSGLDCLPGQENLFETDGHEPTDDENPPVSP